MAIEENPFNHILYEFSMYLQASLIQCNVQFVTNLLVDSRLVHMRNLAYFFCSGKEQSKKYFHYSMFIKEKIPQEIDRGLFTEIQTVTSNSTCHLLRGRLKGSFKQETALLEQRVFPILVSLIKAFLDGLDDNVCSNYADAWADEQIQRDAAGVMEVIQNCELSRKERIVIATTE